MEQATCKGCGDAFERVHQNAKYCKKSLHLICACGATKASSCDYRSAERGYLRGEFQCNGCQRIEVSNRQRACVCENCYADFMGRGSSPKYCLSMREFKCPAGCGAIKEARCDNTLGGKLLRLQSCDSCAAGPPEALAAYTRPCQRCSQEFFSSDTQRVYCLKPIVLACSCGSTREMLCDKYSYVLPTVYTCSTCASRANISSTREKQLATLKDRYGAESFGDLFTGRRGVNHNMRATLLTRHPELLHIDEYMELRSGKTDWFLQFKAERGRMPTVQDMRDYFKATPRRLTDEQRALLSIGKNFHELRVLDVLSTLEVGEVLRRKRPVIVPETSYLYKPPTHTNSNKLEIDFWLPKLSIGFEVNEFSTHSRDSDSEELRTYNGTVKKGPMYHEEKRRLAELQGIAVYFVWEDEIRDGSYKQYLVDICSQHTT